MSRMNQNPAQNIGTTESFGEQSTLPPAPSPTVNLDRTVKSLSREINRALADPSVLEALAERAGKPILQINVTRMKGKGKYQLDVSENTATVRLGNNRTAVQDFIAGIRQGKKAKATASPAMENPRIDSLIDHALSCGVGILKQGAALTFTRDIQQQSLQVIAALNEQGATKQEKALFSEICKGARSYARSQNGNLPEAESLLRESIEAYQSNVESTLHHQVGACFQKGTGAAIQKALLPKRGKQIRKEFHTALRLAASSEEGLASTHWDGAFERLYELGAIRYFVDNNRWNVSIITNAVDSYQNSRNSLLEETLERMGNQRQPERCSELIQIERDKLAALKAAHIMENPQDAAWNPDERAISSLPAIIRGEALLTAFEKRNEFTRHSADFQAALEEGSIDQAKEAFRAMRLSLEGVESLKIESDIRAGDTSGRSLEEMEINLYKREFERHFEDGSIIEAIDAINSLTNATEDKSVAQLKNELLEVLNDYGMTSIGEILEMMSSEPPPSPEAVDLRQFERIPEHLATLGGWVSYWKEGASSEDIVELSRNYTQWSGRFHTLITGSARPAISAMLSDWRKQMSALKEQLSIVQDPHRFQEALPPRSIGNALDNLKALFDDWNVRRDSIGKAAGEFGKLRSEFTSLRRQADELGL